MSSRPSRVEIFVPFRVCVWDTVTNANWGRDLEDLLSILVVEDEVLIQSLLSEALHDGGFEAKITSSGEDAIKLLDAPEPKFRALVTDINLGRGRIDGWDVARHAREVDPEIPVVYMTGDSAADWSAKGVPNSVLVTKPFAPAQILTAVAQLLNTGGAAPTT